MLDLSIVMNSYVTVYQRVLAEFRSYRMLFCFFGGGGSLRKSKIWIMMVYDNAARCTL